MLPHAPGVQMANIPEDGVNVKEDSALEDEADPDKRNPQQVNRETSPSRHCNITIFAFIPSVFGPLKNIGSDKPLPCPRTRESTKYL